MEDKGGGMMIRWLVGNDKKRNGIVGGGDCGPTPSPKTISSLEKSNGSLEMISFDII